MSGYWINLEEETKKNNFFRKVLFTAPKSQLVLMALQPGEEIGMEVHQDHDQFFRFESGRGRMLIDDYEKEVGDGNAVVVPAGEQHNVINTSEKEVLKFYTIYSPPEHPDGTVHRTKTEAEASEK